MTRVQRRQRETSMIPGDIFAIIYSERKESSTHDIVAAGRSEARTAT